MNILISGSNRGLGLELVNQYAEDGWRVFAACRHPAEARDLHELTGRLSRISLHRLDVTSTEDMRAIAWELEDTPVDVLFNNAGIYLEDSYELPRLGSIRYQDWLRTFEVNTLGAVRLTEPLATNIARSEKRLVATMTSHMGSIGDIEMPGSYYYRSSKAALNAAMQGLAQELKEKGIGVLLLRPGGVKTRMGPRRGMSPRDSVRGLRKVIDEFKLEDTGGFLRYDGNEVPW
jgi:NAD(P)-dependent dehydrogenase (short-subunit alcohol dehydrogenase family)